MKDILWLIPIFIIAAGIFVIFTITTSNKGTSQMNLALNQVQLCILSKNAMNRTQADIEECYHRIESNAGIKIDRMDR